MAAAGPVLRSERLREPAAASQQVRLQKVLRQKGPLSAEMLSLVSDVQRTRRAKIKETTTDDIYDEQEVHVWVFYFNPFRG